MDNSKKSYIIDQETFEIICDYIDSVKVLNDAFAVNEDNILLEKDSIDMNLEDIKEGSIPEDRIKPLLHFCEGCTERIENYLNLQKKLNYENRRKIQEAISWL